MEVSVKIIIDRFEDEFAIVEMEDGKILSITKEILPSNAKGGDVISIQIEEKETKKIKDEIEYLMNKLMD